VDRILFDAYQPVVQRKTKMVVGLKEGNREAVLKIESKKKKKKSK